MFFRINYFMIKRNFLNIFYSQNTIQTTEIVQDVPLIYKCVGDCVTNTNIRRYNYFERDLLEHVMIGYLDYMSMTVRNQRWTRSKYFRIGCQVVRNRRPLLTDR